MYTTDKLKNMHYIVGVSGRAGVGKDTVTNMLMKMLSEHNIPNAKYALSSPMDNICDVVFDGIDWRHRDNKEQVFPMPLPFVRDVLYTFSEQLLPQRLWGEARDLIDEVFVEDEYSPRQIKQLYGTEVVRAIYPDAWVEQSKENATSLINILPDVRFENELDAVNVLLHVTNSRVDDVNAHSSESLAKELDECYNERKANIMAGDLGIIFINNDKDFSWLESQLKEVVDGMKSGLDGALEELV